MPYAPSPPRCRYTKDSRLVDASADPWASLQRTKLQLTGDFLGLHLGKTLEVKLGGVIHRQDSAVGEPSCGTLIVGAQCGALPGEKLVVKIDHPPRARFPEAYALLKLRAKAMSDERHNSVLNHVPNLRGFKMLKGLPEEHPAGYRLSQLLRSGDASLRWENAEEPFYYERRTLDCLLQERLHPLSALVDEREIAQVLSDTVRVVGWASEVCMTLHRNISPSNIMYRIVETDGTRKVHGVLNDWAHSGPVSGSDPFLKAPRT